MLPRFVTTRALAGEVVYEVTQLPVVILEIDDGNGRFGRGPMPDVHDDKAPVLAHLGLRNPLRSIGLEKSSSSCWRVPSR